jgi:hypothetical protein
MRHRRAKKIIDTTKRVRYRWLEIEIDIEIMKQQELTQM